MTRLTTLVMVLSLLLLSLPALAQPGNPSTPAPLGGVAILLAAAAGYGIYRKKKD